MSLRVGSFMAFCGACCNSKEAEEVIAVSAIGTDDLKSKSPEAGSPTPKKAATPKKPVAPKKAEAPTKAAEAEKNAKKDTEKVQKDTEKKEKKDELFSVEIPIAQDSMLGIDVNAHDGKTLVVTNVSNGPVLDYNLKNPNNRVLVGDRFVKINGVENDPKRMSPAVKQEAVMKATLKRAEERTFTLVKGEGVTNRGLIASPYDKCVLALSDDPKPGSALALHNEKCPDTAMKKYDYIVAVNGVSETQEKMQGELKSGSSWEITFRRIEGRSVELPENNAGG